MDFRFEKLVVSFKKTSGRLFSGVFLIYSSLVLFFLVDVFPFFSVTLLLPFYLFIPGYALIVILFNHLNRLEKAVASAGLSLALFTGLRALTYTLDITNIVSVDIAMACFSTVCLTVKFIINR